MALQGGLSVRGAVEGVLDLLCGYGGVVGAEEGDGDVGVLGE